MDIWFTSDQHWGHERIRYFEAKNRKMFESTRDMDEYMIETWNKVVKKDDLVYYLGDFALAPKNRKKEIMAHLNGHKISIRGNHDSGPIHMKEIGFSEAYNWMTLNLERDGLPNKRILLIHDSNDFLRKSGEKNNIDYILCGHVHSNWRKRQNVVNVGVDLWGFYPIDLPTALGVLGVDLTGDWNLSVDRVPKWRGATALQEIYSL